MFIFPSLILCAEYVLPEGINSLKYQLKSSEAFSFYTPNQKYLVALTKIDKDATSIYVASPFNGNLEEVTDGRPLYFPSGNSKIVIKPKKDTEIKFATVSIPSKVSCIDGIRTIIDEYDNTSIKLSVNKSGTDYCMFYACDTKEHYYKISENNLLGESKIMAYRYDISSNAFESYTSKGELQKYVSSDNPWFYRLTSSSNENEVGANILLEIYGKKDNANEEQLQKYNGYPKTCKLTNSNQYSKWYLPILGSVAPIILLVSFVYTFFNLYGKESVVVDGGLFDDVEENI